MTSSRRLDVLSSDNRELSAVVFNVQHFCLHDGPGIRTNVFLNGCGLSCLWCCNPEAMDPSPQLGVDRMRCTACGDCVAVCPESALSLNHARLEINRSACTACGLCVAACEPEALTLYGKSRTVEEVFAEVCRDKRWYGELGGVTVSGGEPLTHPAFVMQLFARCRDAGISTCVETCGQVSSDVVAEVLESTDYVMFDLKHMDSAVHRNLTGRPNERILANARLVAHSGVKVQFRMPLIPGLNSNPDNIAATARFLREQQGEDAALELMPYHSLAKGKYDALDMEYRLEELPAAGMDFVKSIQQLYESHGIRCLVSL
jgi:pyruvate formate lyase activating enzyme